MRRLFPVLVLFLFLPVSAAAHYPINATEIHIETMRLDLLLINMTLLQEQLWFFEGNITLGVTNSIPYEIEGYLEGHKAGSGNESCYNWMDMAEISKRVGFVEPDRLNVVVVANLPCKNRPLGCFCADNETLWSEGVSAYSETGLVMVELDRLLANATTPSETSSIVNAEIVEIVKDAAYPPIERIDLAQSPMILGSSFHLIFLKCNAEADVSGVVQSLEEVLPGDTLLTYEQRVCTEVEYGNLITAEEVEDYLYLTPSLFGLNDYTDTGNVPIALVRSLEEFEAVTPFFAVKGQEEFSEEDVLRVIARYFGLLDVVNQQSVTGGSGTFDQTDMTRLDIIFNVWRRDVSARDALLRISFIRRLNMSLTYENTGSLSFYPGFEDVYSSMVADFKSGRYHEIINTTEELTSIFESQGYWSSWADLVLGEIESIEGYENCAVCGDGCYGFEGICCDGMFHAGGSCCDGDCGFGFECIGNVCAFDWWLIALSLSTAIVLVVPVFALVFLVLFSHNRMKRWRIKLEYRKLSGLGLKEDKIYFKLFQKGYGKGELDEALGHAKREEREPKEKK
jgi:hypothetical protein